MDTTGVYPKLLNTDPLYEIAEYTQQMYDKLTSTWTPLTLGNGWLAYVGGGGYYNGLRCRRNGDNVQISGMIKSGAANTVMATLPAGLRPLYTAIVFVNSSGGAGQLLVQGGTGTLTYMTGSPTTPAYLNINIIVPLS